MKKKEKYSVGIYARLSVEHERKTESIASQIAIVQSYLTQHEEMELQDCYIDLGESGTHFQRNGFSALMKAVRSGEVNCVIVKDFSRFGRNYLEVGNYIDKIFPFLGVRFISVTDGFDSQNREGGEWDKNLKNLINECYASDTARKVKAVKRFYREKESYIGGRAPYGYRIEKKEGKRILAADKMALEVVKTIWQFYLDGKGQREIAVWLYQNRVYRPSDYRKTGYIYCKKEEFLLEWNRGSIERILKNPIYVQKETGILTEEQKQILQDKKAILSETEKSRDTKENKKRKRIGGNHLWKQMLYCGDCHHAFVCRGDLKRKIYDCSQTKRLDMLQCKKKPITEETLSYCVILLFQQLFQNMSSKKEADVILKNSKKEGLEEFTKKQIVQMRRMEKQIAAQKRRISDSYKNYQTGRVGREEFLIQKAKGDKKTENVTIQKKKVLQQIESVKQAVTEINDWVEKIKKGEQDWLKETEFLPCVIKQIKLFCGKRMIIQLRIRREEK